jgi:hypothetical protein
MIYNSISVKNVIGRVVRNLDNKIPGHYLDYMLEWIPEAMEELHTPYQVVTKSTPNEGLTGAIVTNQHVAALPCGLINVIAVEDEFGYRVREGADVTDITSHSPRYNSRGSQSGARSTNFQMDSSQVSGVNPATSGPTNGSVAWDGSNIVPVEDARGKAYYKIQMGHIQTSEEEMFLKIHYKALPVDDEGYPLVPDVTEYKEAVYWYILNKMMGAGYKHPTIPPGIQGMEYCSQKYEFYAGRALGKIKMPTQDRMARLRDGFAQRMIPPNHFYEDFGINGEQVQPINGI